GTRIFKNGYACRFLRRRTLGRGFDSRRLQPSLSIHAKAVTPELGVRSIPPSEGGPLAASGSSFGLASPSSLSIHAKAVTPELGVGSKPPSEGGPLAASGSSFGLASPASLSLHAKAVTPALPV